MASTSAGRHGLCDRCRHQRVVGNTRGPRSRSASHPGPIRPFPSIHRSRSCTAPASRPGPPCRANRGTGDQLSRRLDALGGAQGPRRGDHDQRDRNQLAPHQVLAEDDHTDEGGDGGLEAEQHPECLLGQPSQGLELDRVGNRRTQQGHPQSDCEDPRIEQLAATVGDPDRISRTEATIIARDSPPNPVGPLPTRAESRM